MSKSPHKRIKWLQHLYRHLWPLLQKSWPIWTSVLSVLLGLGIIQVQAIRLIVPTEYLGYLFLGVLLLWSICAVIILSIKSGKLESNLKILQQEVNALEKRTSPSFLLEDIVLSSLTAHVELRKATRKLNPVKLDVFRLDCKVVGSDVRKAADATYYLKGINLSDHTLTGLYLSIAGDNLVPFRTLNAKLYNLHSNSGRSYPLFPRLEGADSVRKDLFLPFVSPGIEPLSAFEVELEYQWPGVFAPVKDYWFLDHVDYEGQTKQIIMTMEFIDLIVNSVRVYVIDMLSKIPTFLGDLASDPNNPKRFFFDKTNPERDSYYIFVFESA